MSASALNSLSKHEQERQKIPSFRWLPFRQYISQTCNFARHLSLGGSMVRASRRSLEGCGLDPHLGLRNRFSKVRI